MDRQQKIAKVASQDGKVSKISNLQVKPDYISQHYKYEPCDGVLTEAGKLEVLKLVPKSGDGPRFTARWNQKPEQLDIDMSNEPASAIKRFKKNEGGYLGHHTCRSSEPDKRVFVVEIRIPSYRIFSGMVSFSNTYEKNNAENTYFGDSVEAQVIRGPLLT